MRRTIVLILVLAAALVAACTGPRMPGRGPETAPLPTPSVVPPVPKKAPNIVLLLADDFSMDLLRAMRYDDVMRRSGAEYNYSFVTDSLCCVSRSSLFTGGYPHQSGVYTNTRAHDPSLGLLGGWPAFQGNDNVDRSFNVRLQEAGYETGFIGKYLNQYEAGPEERLPDIPRGWSDLQVIFGSAYDGWQYSSTVTHNGVVRLLPEERPPPYTSSISTRDHAYVGSDITRRTTAFLNEHRDSERPYFLEVATYAPHNTTGGSPYPDEPRFPAAFGDRPRPGDPDGDCGPVLCTDLTVADIPGFGDDRSDNRPRHRDGTPAPDWNDDPEGLSAGQAEYDLRNRARMVQSIDRTLERILRLVDDNTYVVLTSDNGLHLGQHGLGMGKGAPYDSDIRVPLLVVGPDVRPGERHEVVSNLDLSSTFEDLAGLEPAPYRSGRSLVPTFTDPQVNRRDYAFVEHTWSMAGGEDPDRAFAERSLDRIPSYVAVRGRQNLLVRFDVDDSPRGTRYVYEFYDYTDAPYERTNTFGAPDKQPQVRELMGALDRWDACSGLRGDDPVTPQCRAMHEATERTTAR